MIRLTAHAEEMIEERGIARAWVEGAVRAPDHASADPRDPALTRSFRVVPEAGYKVLRVVHRPDGADILVITAHFDRDARR